MKYIILFLILGKFLTVQHQTYVPFEMGQVMQWHESTPYGSTSLMAHDWLEGQSFEKLKVGDPLRIVYSDWTFKDYVVSEIVISEKNNDNDDDFFYRIFRGRKLILQTCHGDGNLFVIAYKK